MTSRDEISMKGSVAIANIYRSKGNEAPMVYVVNAQYCFSGYELTKLRNVLFTAITRCRAWVRISGWGSGMLKLMEEINAIQTNHYRLSFRIPTTEGVQPASRGLTQG
jgi:superfamily I DNA and RNA helicase